MSPPGQFKDVTRGYTLQTTEKAIAVSCDPQVAGLANASCPEDPSHTAIQREVIRIVEDRHFEIDLGYMQNSQREIGLLRDTLLVRGDPPRRP